MMSTAIQTPRDLLSSYTVSQMSKDERRWSRCHPTHILNFIQMPSMYSTKWIFTQASARPYTVTADLDLQETDLRSHEYVYDADLCRV
ncbi:hypothetical protein N7539_000782 [Penicillium diatomitis]|uniref:Uncharacterized protein n=1 Tax=Penicillium diatomitis TaxID=2819901 RepID=A0A9W9XMB8_9EURO|nr:uncharacterized protein N7539_000782 [Penicillium diatomitis]KAJ5495666.1 hypothetical protein N7539_000782 [Penicillium diatomitis]